MASEITWRSSAGGVGRHPKNPPKRQEQKQLRGARKSPGRAHPPQVQTGTQPCFISDRGWQGRGKRPTCQPGSRCRASFHRARFLPPSLYARSRERPSITTPCLPAVGTRLGPTPTSPHLTRQRLAPRLPIYFPFCPCCPLGGLYYERWPQSRSLGLAGWILSPAWQAA